MANRGHVLGLLLLSVFASPAAWSGRPYTIDDVLKLEMLGKGTSDPSGRWFVWEQAPAYDTLQDFSVPGIGAWGSAGFRLMKLDLAARSSTAQPLFAADPARSHWIEGFSPGGRFLLFYSAKQGVYSMGTFDVEAGRLTTFDAPPRVDPFNGSGAVWVSPEEFVFAAHDAGKQPIDAVRPYTGQRLWNEWNAAWRGELSVSEVVSRADGGGDRLLQGRLIKANARTGELQVLANNMYDSIRVSADGRYLAALRQYSRPQAEPGTSGLDWTLSRSELVLLDLEKGGLPQTIAADKDVYPSTLEWAPDRNALAFFAWSVGAGVRSGIFHVLDADTGSVSPVPHIGLDLASERERGFAQKPERVVWINGQLAVFARENSNADRTPTITYREITGAGTSSRPPKADWFLIDGSGGRRNLTKRFARISAVPLFADAQSLVVLADGAPWRIAPDAAPVNLANDARGELSLSDAMEFSIARPPYARYVTLVDRDVRAPRFALIDMVGRRTQVVRAPSVSAAYIADAGSSGAVLFRERTEKGTNLIVSRSGGRQASVARLNEYVRDIQHTAFTPIRYAVRSAGKEHMVDACMIVPPGYVRGERRPVIVDIYPSVDAGCLDSQYEAFNGMAVSPGPYDLHVLAARGYIVFRPNTSREITHLPQNPLGGMASAVSQGIDALVAQGFADPKRIGLIGVSQGGFSSLWLATQLDRFKAVVSMNGWSDMYSHVFEGTVLRRFYADDYPYLGEAMRYETTEGTDFGIGQTSWENPDAYVRNSPLFQARKVSAPLMLIHSDMDGFTLSQYEMMFTALYRERKEARFLRFAGEGHAPSSPANIRYMWNAIFEWFDKYVKSPP